MYIAEHQAVMGHPETVSEKVSKCHLDWHGHHAQTKVCLLVTRISFTNRSCLSPMLNHCRDVTCTDLKLYIRICLSQVSKKCSYIYSIKILTECTKEHVTEIMWLPMACIYANEAALVLTKMYVRRVVTYNYIASYGTFECICHNMVKVDNVRPSVSLLT